MDAEFRVMLLRLSKGIHQTELGAMKYMVSSDIGRRRLEECKTVYDFWQALEQKELILPNDVAHLKKILTEALHDREDLLRTVKEYEDKYCVQHCSVTSSSPSDSTSGLHSDIDLAAETEFVVNAIGRDWKQLARKLKLSEHEINCLVEKHRGDLQEQAQAMLTMWLKKKQPEAETQPAALKELIACLVAAGRRDIADDLRNSRHVLPVTA